MKFRRFKHLPVILKGDQKFIDHLGHRQFWTIDYIVGEPPVKEFAEVCTRAVLVDERLRDKDIQVPVYVHGLALNEDDPDLSRLVYSRVRHNKEGAGAKKSLSLEDIEKYTVHTRY